MKLTKQAYAKTELVNFHKTLQFSEEIKKNYLITRMALSTSKQLKTIKINRQGFYSLTLTSCPFGVTESVECWAMTWRKLRRAHSVSRFGRGNSATRRCSACSRFSVVSSSVRYIKGMLILHIKLYVLILYVLIFNMNILHLFVRVYFARNNVNVAHVNFGNVSFKNECKMWKTSHNCW